MLGECPILSRQHGYGCRTSLNSIVVFGASAAAGKGAPAQPCRPAVSEVKPSFSLTAWFSVLVVFVLAEVFREGARLRREAELTI